MSETEKAYELIRYEMSGVWIYLNTYVELFEHPDSRRRNLMGLTAPGFFEVVKASLAECILQKLARLMDPAETGGKKNMTFAALFDLGNPVLKQSFCGFCAIQYEWKAGKYKPIREYRNKLAAHNDWITILENPLGVLTRLTDQEQALTKELFQGLWHVLAKVHFALHDSSLAEPQYENLDSLPTALFSHLGNSLLLRELNKEQMHDENLEILRKLSEFEYSNVGNDAPMRLIGN
jgi:hypothetical protein